jgi:sec-independent protein translocase protein TatA
MFGLGMPELGLILIIALVMFGAKNLPDIGKTFGKAVHELRKATTGTEPEKNGTEKKETPQDKDRETKK